MVRITLCLMCCACTTRPARIAVSAGTPNGRAAFLVRTARGTERVTLDGQRHLLFGPSYVPITRAGNGDVHALTDTHWRLHVWRRGWSEPRHVPQFDGYLGPVAISHTGDRIAVAMAPHYAHRRPKHGDDTVYVVDTNKLQVSRFAPARSFHIQDLWFAGDRVYYNHRPRDGTHYLDLNDGTRARHEHAPIPGWSLHTERQYGFGLPNRNRFNCGKGRILHRDDGLYIDRGGDDPRRLLKVDRGSDDFVPFSRPIMAPDCRHVVFEFRPQISLYPGAVYAADLRTGRVYKILDAGTDVARLGINYYPHEPYE